MMAKGVRDDEFDFERSLLTAMEEVLAFERGELELRTRTVGLPDSQVQVPAPPEYDGARIRAVRDKLALSPQNFAAALNVSPQTIRAWERGARRPEGPTLRLLEIAEEHPEALLATIAPSAHASQKAGQSERRAG